MRRETNDFERAWINLASIKLGSSVLFATDDFFAEKDNLIKVEPAVFLPDKYTSNGKWMDGWESRRKREPGHDYAIIKLGLAGRIYGVDIDTSFFTGNHPPHASLEGCALPDGSDLTQLEAADWVEIVPKSAIGPGQSNLFPCSAESIFTHVRLRIFPDGGVARLRVYGRADRNVATNKNGIIDLAGVVNGGLVLQCNDMYFSPKDNMIMPYEPEGMFDGWETRRRREPGNDWSILSLAAPGVINRIDLNTAFFKGNYPDSFSIEATLLDSDRDLDKATWRHLITKTKLKPDHLHSFGKESLLIESRLSHLRLNIYPDGGVARLRCYGEVR